MLSERDTELVLALENPPKPTKAMLDAAARTSKTLVRGRPDRLDIVCIGEPLFELNQPKGEDIFRSGHGGDTSNCAIAAARQGASVAYVTSVGADQFGESFLRLWAAEGVDTTRSRGARAPIPASISSLMGRRAMSSLICAPGRRRAA